MEKGKREGQESMIGRWKHDISKIYLKKEQKDV